MRTCGAITLRDGKGELVFPVVPSRNDEVWIKMEVVHERYFPHDFPLYLHTPFERLGRIERDILSMTVDFVPARPLGDYIEGSDNIILNDDNLLDRLLEGDFEIMQAYKAHLRRRFYVLIEMKAGEGAVLPFYLLCDNGLLYNMHLLTCTIHYEMFIYPPRYQ